MKKEFVPYDIALALKELGFDNIGCLGVYYCDGSELTTEYYETQYYAQKGFQNGTLAPLYQQVFRWFREKYKLYATVYPTSTNQFGTTLCKGVNEKFYGDELPLFKTFAEAQNACLRKLIEIVKENL